jgi:hypothetical protein
MVGGWLAGWLSLVEFLLPNGEAEDVGRVWVFGIQKIIPVSSPELVCE